MKWVSVNKRLPSKPGKYLIKCKRINPAIWEWKWIKNIDGGLSWHSWGQEDAEVLNNISYWKEVYPGWKQNEKV